MKIAIVCICFVLFIITTTANSECILGQFKKSNCKLCRCTKGGRWYCTSYCVRKQSWWLEPCKEEGAHRMLDCNVCTCSGNQWECTMMACPPKKRIATETNTFSCTPGKTFKKDCNNCTCARDGKSAACTLKACPPKSKN